MRNPIQPKFEWAEAFALQQSLYSDLIEYEEEDSTNPLLTPLSIALKLLEEAILKGKEN